jgi:hypothetical protein
MRNSRKQPARFTESRQSSSLAWASLATACTVAAAACGTGKPFDLLPEGAAAGDGATQAGDGAGGSGAKASGGDDGGGRPMGGASHGGDAATPGGDGTGAEAGSHDNQAGADPGPGAPSCKEACQDPKPFCTDVDGTPTCINPAQALSGKRIELGCVASDDAVSQLCPTVADRATQCPAGGKLSMQTIELSGDPATLYSVTLHVRGVLEPRSYVGGKDAGNHFYVGGTGQQPSFYNTYSIAVSSPAQTFYLNADTKAESYRVFALDHQKAIVVAGGASITLQVLDPDCAMVKNCQSFETSVCTPHVVAGVPPAPMAFNGQFVQLDVVSVMPSK